MIPRSRRTRSTALVEDARAIGLRLTQEVEVAPGQSAHLVVVDADGRPTTYHAMSAEEITPGTVVPEPVNGFNALLGVAVMRTIFHITGDEEIGRFYYGELVSERKYFDTIERTSVLIYQKEQTNYSNVNMAFLAALGVLRYESDPALRAQMQRILQDELYAPGAEREARGLGMSLFDFVYAAYAPDPGSAMTTAAVAEALATLSDVPEAPYWNEELINCDEFELDSLDCVGIDGTPLPLADRIGRSDIVVAVAPVPMRIRPPSNYIWRTDPHQVNGEGSDRLNPGGGAYCAYWLGRFLSPDGAEANLSPRLRAPIVIEEPATPPDGCSISTSTTSPSGGTAALLLLAFFLCGRRRAPRSRPASGSRRSLIGTGLISALAITSQTALVGCMECEDSEVRSVTEASFVASLPETLAPPDATKALPSVLGATGGAVYFAVGDDSSLPAGELIGALVIEVDQIPAAGEEIDIREDRAVYIVADDSLSENLPRLDHPGDTYEAAGFMQGLDCDLGENCHSVRVAMFILGEEREDDDRIVGALNGIWTTYDDTSSCGL